MYAADEFQLETSSFPAVRLPLAALIEEQQPVSSVENRVGQQNIFFHTSKNDDVPTPPDLLADLDRLFRFDHDPCPLFGLHNDDVPDGLSLDVPWGSRNFVNPPFSDIKPWICRAVCSETLCVMLLPARPHSLYWRQYVWPNAKTIYFLCEGIQFPGYRRTFPCPMTIVVFYPSSYRHAIDNNDEAERASYVAPTIQHLSGIPVVTVHLRA